MNAASLQGTVDAVDLDAVLLLLQTASVDGRLDLEGRGARGSIDLAAGRVLDVVVDGRPSADELARRSAEVLGVAEAERRPDVLAGLLADLVGGADSFAFRGRRSGRGPRDVVVPIGSTPSTATAVGLDDLRRRVAAIRPTRHDGPTGDDDGRRGGAWVRRTTLPAGIDGAALDRLGWWVAARCGAAVTAEELVDAGGLTRAEVAEALADLAAAGLVEPAAPGLEVEPARVDPSPVAPPIPAWPPAPGEVTEPVRAGVDGYDDAHPGWAALTRAVLGPAAPVADIEDLRDLRQLDPAARDRRRTRRRGGLAVTT